MIEGNHRINLADDKPFVEWLGKILLCDGWNGRVRTPRAWHRLFTEGLTPEQAAVSTKY